MAGFTTYPNGIGGQGLLIREVPVNVAYPGQVFWVYNGTALGGARRNGSDANRGTFNSPFATVAYAITQCVAGRGDVIMVKSGHAETLTSATALTANVAGVAIVGLGAGSYRPTFTFTTANTATIAVSADNVAFVNCRFVANFLSIAAPFTLTTAKNFTLQACDFSETSSVLNFLNIVKSTGAANTADGLNVIDCSWSGLGTTSVNSFVLTANDIDSLILRRNRVKLARTVDAAILTTVTAGVLTNLECGDNFGYSGQTTTANGSLINVGGTTSTGWVYRNYVQTLTTTADKLFTTTVGLSAFENRVTGVVGAQGFPIPALDS